MGVFQKFCEWGTDSKYVSPSRKCDVCGGKLGFLETGFWSINAKQLSDAVLCSHCYEKLERLAEYRTACIKPALRKEPPFKGFTVKAIPQLSLETAKEILETSVRCGEEELSVYGSEYTSLFRMRKAVFIYPTALQVGVVRQKRLNGKLVVFGFVQLGQFQKGDEVLIVDGEERRKAAVLEAYVFDCEENDLEVNLKANMGKHRLSCWQTGWLVLDSTEALNTDVTVIC